MDAKTVIVGGGMAGMSCALALKERGRDFVMITENLGGRVRYSPEYRVNYGAYFVMRNYHNAKKILKKEAWINPLGIQFVENESLRMPVLGWKTITRIPGLLRFVKLLLVFSSHYEKFKRNCTLKSQMESLKEDAYLYDLYFTSSSDFIKKHGMEKLAADYISKFTYACTLTPIDNLSAFDVMTVALGLMPPMHTFSFDEKGMAGLLKDELVTGTVSAVKKTGGRYTVTAADGVRYVADTLVMATPAVVTQKLLKIPGIRKTSSAYVYHLKGAPRERYAPYSLNLYSPAYEISALARQHDGTYLLFSCIRDLDLNKYFAHYETIRKVEWEKALYVIGREFLEQRYDENCYIAGDHNSLGLEPACISGIYAANQIINN